MKNKHLLLGAVTTAAVLLPAAVSAHTEVYKIVLSGLNENPVNASPATGLATVTLDLDLFTMRVEASFSGLTGTVTASHIHCCSVPPANAGVASQTPSFTGFPTGVSSGSYDHTFDMTLAGSYNAAFITANGGTISTAFNALKAGMDSGMAYLNIHTTTFGGGEIRGALMVQAVPEPASYALMGAGLLALLGVVKRRRARQP